MQCFTACKLQSKYSLHLGHVGQEWLIHLSTKRKKIIGILIIDFVAFKEKMLNALMWNFVL